MTRLNHYLLSLGFNAIDCAIVAEAMKGKAVKEIAAVVFRSHLTVQCNLGRAYKRLGVKSKAAMIAKLGGMMIEWSRSDKPKEATGG